MNPSGIQEMPRTSPEYRGNSPETRADWMRFGRGSQIRAVKSGQSVRLLACADLP